MGALFRWLGRAAASLLSALLLVGIGFYLHFLWSGPPLEPWHRVRLTSEFTADDYEQGRIVTLEQYRAREQQLLEQVRTEIALPPAGENELAINRYIARQSR